MAANRRQLRYCKEFFWRVSPVERFHRPEKFRKRYRLTKETIQELAADFGRSQFATKGTRSGGGLSHEERVCLAIRFLASGSIYSMVCDSQGVDPSTVCRSVDAFLKYMHSVKGRYIKWPKYREYCDEALNWHKIKQFPKVIGAVDGTHIAIRCPTRGDRVYYSRKHYHSLNVLASCRSDMQFTFVNSRMPGSCHDSYVFTNSAHGKKAIDTGFHPFVLLGDAGYPLCPYMLTPFSNPKTPGEIAYNEAHKSTRCTVERAFGVLKQRFRVLDLSEGYIMSTPEKSSLIVMACCCLHNLAIQKKQELDIDEDELRKQLRAEQAHGPEIAAPDRRREDQNLYLEGVELRKSIVERYFSNN